jgi:GNAT superfamily N-acetyltransferase
MTLRERARLHTRGRRTAHDARRTTGPAPYCNPARGSFSTHPPTKERVKPVHPIALREADPLSPEALRLLHEAALEARALYPELHDPDAPAPTNRPTPPRGVYLIAFAGSEPVGMAAHRPLDERTSEVRRMFVTAAARQRGVGLALLQRLEAHARSEGFERLVLETGHRQIPAMRLYEHAGYHRIPAFGPYAGDPTSVCFAKELVGPGVGP